MSSLALKLIAIVTMTIDHTGAVLYWVPKYREIAWAMRLIGRIAFPIYAFLIAVGMQKTKNREKYLLRLLVFALISFVPFSLFYNINAYGLSAKPVYLEFNHTNVFFTLFLGAAAIYIYEFAKKHANQIGSAVVGAAAAAGCGLLANLISTDYGMYGVLVICLTYAVISVKDNFFLRTLPAFAWVFVQYFNYSSEFKAFAVIGPLFMLLYDGTPGPERLRGRFKIAFYAFYPVHIMLLYLLSITLRNI